MRVMAAAARASSSWTDPRAVTAADAVRRVTLAAFRCYGQLRLEVDRGPVVLTGPNGAGKTALLEALSMLAPGRGLRRAALGDLARRKPGGEAPTPWSVAARVDAAGGEIALGTGQDPASRERRVLRIDGEKIRGQKALAERLAIAWATPEQDRLFLDGPGARRRFLDRLVLGFEPGHAAELAAYEHCQRERARLLAEGSGDDAWLSALEDGMARHGIAVAAARRAVAERLDAAALTGRDGKGA